MYNTLILSYPASKALKKLYKKTCLNPKDAILFSSLFLHLFGVSHCTLCNHHQVLLQLQSSNYDLSLTPFFHKFFLCFFNSLTGPLTYLQSQARITHTKDQRNQTSPKYLFFFSDTQAEKPGSHFTRLKKFQTCAIREQDRSNSLSGSPENVRKKKPPERHASAPNSGRSRSSVWRPGFVFFRIGAPGDGVRDPSRSVPEFGAEAADFHIAVGEGGSG